MEQLGESRVIVNSWLALGITLVLVILSAYAIHLLYNRYIQGEVFTKRQRRMAHLRYVRETIGELKYKIINLSLSHERGDLSESAYLRRVKNAAHLVRRYEVKKNKLNRLVK